MFFMIKDIETLFFIKELGRLFDDYKRCPDQKTKALIEDEILFLTEIINPV
ncbi:hypothetical protein BSG1_14493 [Bacillus sp. SG-1]|nr:hypothetical protein BSG1_14493 [Bacillus sp. SG-1]